MNRVKRNGCLRINANLRAALPSPPNFMRLGRVFLRLVTLERNM